MIKLSELAPRVAAVLNTIDTSVYISRKRKRVATVPLSWLVTALIWFACVGLKRWKTYVQVLLPLHLPKYRLSYSRWCFWRAELSQLLEAVAHAVGHKAGYRGLAFIDSTALPVCAIARERDHKCFSGEAAKSKNSLGWFLGYKLHLVTSDQGELLRFRLTPGTTHDNSSLKNDEFLQNICGRLVADSGYRGKAQCARWLPKGLAVFARPYGVKDADLPTGLRILFRLRWRIETVIGQLKHDFGLDNLRFCSRRPTTFKTTLWAALCAYTLAR